MVDNVKTNGKSIYFFCECENAFVSPSQLNIFFPKQMSYSIVSIIIANFGFFFYKRFNTN